MPFRASSLILGAAAVLASLSLASNDANACGGCFHEPPDPVDPRSQSTVVTGHRMAVSISTERTVLWDQISYAGDPQEFAWVLPVKPGATLSLAADAFFEALEGATATNILSPSISCPSNNGGFGANDGGWDDGDYRGNGSGNSGCNGFGCGSLAAGDGYASGAGGSYGAGAGGGAGAGYNEPPPPDPVSVVHQESIGPYETVTIHSNVPGALYDWLDSHGYAVDEPIKPIIDDYETNGFDFIALRLIPGINVRQMQPVRVVSPGASPVLPLRMVAAGTGANVAITLFVIGEGRWETQSFPNGTVYPGDLDWDFGAKSSNYSQLREQALGQLEGKTWLTTYARRGSLLNAVSNPARPNNEVIYTTSDGFDDNTIAGLYMQQGKANGADVDASCVEGVLAYGGLNGSGRVVDPCADGGAGAGGGSGGTGGAGGAMGGAGGAGAGGSETGVGGAGAGGTGGAGTGGDACTGTVGENEIDARDFTCGTLDDLSVALVGLHPEDVWITRLEASLPQAALADDLAFQAEMTQIEQPNWFVAQGVVNPPCADWIPTSGDDFGMAAPPGPRADRRPPRRGPPPGGPTRDAILTGIILAIIASAAARRLSRPVLRAARQRP